jgi:hypothetical protein
MSGLRRIVQQWWWAAMLAVQALAAGCSQRAEVGGTVTLDGRPLTAGVVTFCPTADGPSGYAAIGSDGRYAVQVGSRQGLPPGRYVVTVAANVPPAEGSQPGPGQFGDGITPLATPQVYADREQSPLRATLVSGSQELVLELTSQ